jgi:hypothetical protein
MDTSFLIYIILSIIIIVVVFLAISWALTTQTIPVYDTAPQYTLASFGGRCTNETLANGQNRPDEYTLQKCAFGLSCVNGYCFKNLGTECNTLFECVPGTLVCNGHCSNTGKGGLNDICSVNTDCDTGLSCNNGLCKNNIGTACLTTADCVSSGFCNNSICTLYSDPGQICTTGNSASNSCGLGFTCSTSAPPIGGVGTYPSFCQPSNTSNGLQDAYCSLWNDPNSTPVTNGGTYQYVDGVVRPSCTNNYTCNNNRGGDGLATADGVCNVTGVWDGDCDSSTGCLNPQVCVQGRCKLPVDISGLPDVFSCDRLNSTGLCFDDYKCVNTKCIGVNSNIPAVTGNQCTTSLSTTRQIVWKYFDESSWKNSNIVLPPLTGDVYFTSLEDGNLTVLMHQFENNSYYICSSNGYTEQKISSNIVGTFSTTISYMGTTIDNNPDFTAILTVDYEGKADYIGYTTRGNYFTVIRYTVTNTNYTSTPYGGIYSIPEISDFSRIYYDTVTTFSNNTLQFDGNNYPVYNYYNDGMSVKIIKYVYSVSVDDRVIDFNFPNEVRIFIVTNDTLKPISSNNEGLSQRKGAIVSARMGDTYYPVSKFNSDGSTDYGLTWCQACIYRTINSNNALRECFGRTNLLTRRYISNVIGRYYTSAFPYEEKTNRYAQSIGMHNSSVFDLNKSRIAYTLNYLGNYYLGTTYNNQDSIIVGAVDENTILSVPFISTNLDSISYNPKILLYTKVCT